jgi:hypothetical protein
MLCLCRAAFAALVFLPIGYLLLIVNNLNGDGGSYSFPNWLSHDPVSALGWATFGAVLGCLWHTISRMNSN